MCGKPKRSCLVFGRDSRWINRQELYHPGGEGNSVANLKSRGLGDSQSEEELVEYTKKEMDFGIKLDAMIDNMKLSGLNRYRVLSPIFDVVLPEKNLFGGRPGPTRGVSDGYWLFLQPLHQGKHTIRTFGSCLAGKIRIGVNYDITSIWYGNYTKDEHRKGSESRKSSESRV